MTTDEHDQNAEAKSLRQTHDDVAVAGPAHHVRHVVGAVYLEQKNRDQITDTDPYGDAFRHQ